MEKRSIGKIIGGILMVLGFAGTVLAITIMIAAIPFLRDRNSVTGGSFQMTLGVMFFVVFLPLSIISVVVFLKSQEKISIKTIGLMGILLGFVGVIFGILLVISSTASLKYPEDVSWATFHLNMGIIYLIAFPLILVAGLIPFLKLKKK